MATHLVKVKYMDDLRIMEIRKPPRYDGLVKAVTAAYGVPLGRELIITYRDSDGDEVRFDTDDELALAFRTSSEPLRITIQTQQSRANSAAADANFAAGTAGADSSHSIPSTTGYPVGSSVGSVVGSEDAGMFVVDLPGEDAVAAGPSPSPAGSMVDPISVSGIHVGGGENILSESEIEDEKDSKEIDGPAAFEAEAAAARDPEKSLLYRKASMSLANLFKVHLTPTQLWRVMALFQMQGRKLVVLGLAPPKALDASVDPLSPSGVSSDEESGRGGGAAAGSCSLKRSMSTVARGIVADPVHRLLALNGVELPANEVQPLLEALRVHPKRLVKIGLLAPELLADIAEGHRAGKSFRGGPPGHPVHPVYPGNPMHGHGRGGHVWLGRGLRVERFGRGRGGGRRGGPGPGPGSSHSPSPFPNHHCEGGGGGGGGAFSPARRGGSEESGHPPQHPPRPHMMGRRMGGPLHTEPSMNDHGHGHGRHEHPSPNGPPPHTPGESPGEGAGGAEGFAPPRGRPAHLHHQPPHPHPHPHPRHLPPPMWYEGRGGSYGYRAPGGPPGGGYGYYYDGAGGGSGRGWGGWAGPYNGSGGDGVDGCSRAGGSPECGMAKKVGFGKGTRDNMAMARFVSHTSGSDVAKVAPGKTFKKSWLVRNDSTTTWPETCSLVPVSQSCADLSSPQEAPIVGGVAPGEEATVSVELVAPSQPGMYEGYWRARDSFSRRFGQRLWAKVMVVADGEEVNAAVEKLSLDDNGNKDN